MSVFVFGHYVCFWLAVFRFFSCHFHFQLASCALCCLVPSSSFRHFVVSAFYCFSLLNLIVVALAVALVVVVMDIAQEAME